MCVCVVFSDWHITAFGSISWKAVTHFQTDAKKLISKKNIHKSGKGVWEARVVRDDGGSQVVWCSTAACGRREHAVHDIVFLSVFSPHFLNKSGAFSLLERRIQICQGETRTFVFFPKKKKRKRKEKKERKKKRKEKERKGNS